MDIQEVQRIIVEELGITMEGEEEAIERESKGSELDQAHTHEITSFNPTQARAQCTKQPTTSDNFIYY